MILELQPDWIITPGERVRARKARAHLSHIAHADAEARRMRAARERMEGRK